jgi:hypothetical protein
MAKPSSNPQHALRTVLLESYCLHRLSVSSVTNVSAIATGEDSPAEEQLLQEDRGDSGKITFRSNSIEHF